jgi:hypothetical protein
MKKTTEPFDRVRPVDPVPQSHCRWDTLVDPPVQLLQLLVFHFMQCVWKSVELPTHSELCESLECMLAPLMRDQGVSVTVTHEQGWHGSGLSWSAPKTL